MGGGRNTTAFSFVILDEMIKAWMRKEEEKDKQKDDTKRAGRMQASNHDG